MALFTAAELGDWLGKPVTAARATVAERVVWGWLSPILGTETQPAPVPAALFSWALELGAIAHENPAGLTTKEIGPFREQYAAERRAEILDEVRGSTLAGGDGTALQPSGTFPEAPCYPDPAW